MNINKFLKLFGRRLCYNCGEVKKKKDVKYWFSGTKMRMCNACYMIFVYLPSKKSTIKKKTQTVREMIAKGTITRVFNKDGRYGVQLDNEDVWYNGFGNANVENGDKVEFEYLINGRFKNIKGAIKKIGETTAKKMLNESAQTMASQFVSGD